MAEALSSKPDPGEASQHPPWLLALVLLPTEGRMQHSVTWSGEAGDP